MKDEPNAEEGLYPFVGCCEHAFRVHSTKACQIPGCQCKRRRQLPRATPSRTPVAAEVSARLDQDLFALLQDPRWEITHEILRGTETTMVITRVIRPDGTELDQIAWTP